MTGFSGTFVIAWSQTTTNGVRAADLAELSVGASWTWTGKPVRIDGPGNALVLDDAIGAAELRRRAAKTVRRLVGQATMPRTDTDPDDDDGPVDAGFTVTDGRRTYQITVIKLQDAMRPLLMFVGEAPPGDQETWIVSSTIEAGAAPFHRDHGAGVICFAAGTLIDCESGQKRVEDIWPGDKVQTKDDGLQEVLWTGSKRMSGARLYAMPELRPIRIAAGALGLDRPQPDLLVSPQHRVLVQGKQAELLFNTPEVLVAAEDLVNDDTVLVDYEIREISYYHVMTERHQVVFANGVETESFHPANTLLSSVEENQLQALLEIEPGLLDDPHSYGEYARRNLSRSDAAILSYGT